MIPIRRGAGVVLGLVISYPIWVYSLSREATPHAIVRFATTVASGHAILATKRTLLLNLDRTSTGRIAPALPGALIQSLHRRVRAVWVARGGRASLPW